MKIFPVVLFVYNRPTHTRKTLTALSLNKLARQTTLYIFSDGPKNDREVQLVSEVRAITMEQWGFKEVITFESEINKGLSSSIINGLSELFQVNLGLIVLEDDVVVSKNFLEYMNNSMNAFSGEEEIAGVTGYSYPFRKKIKIPDFYILPIGSSWGWGTWDRVWNSTNFNTSELINQINSSKKAKEFNFGDHNFYEMLLRQEAGEIDSWAIRFYASFFIRNQKFVFPKYSMIKNIGFDGSGSHSTKFDEFYNTKQKHRPFERMEIKLIPELVLQAQSIRNRRKIFLKVVNFLKKHFHEM